MISLIGNIQDRERHTERKRIRACQGLGEGEKRMCALDTGFYYEERNSLKLDSDDGYTAL